MLRGDYVLGGEQSGHIINRDVSTTGDGLATASCCCRRCSEMDAPLHEAAKIMERLPQKLVNVPVRDKDACWSDATAVWDGGRCRERRLGGGGRVLVRPSGTEPLVRVMCRGADDGRVCAVCKRLGRRHRATTSGRIGPHGVDDGRGQRRQCRRSQSGRLGSTRTRRVHASNSARPAPVRGRPGLGVHPRASRNRQAGDEGEVHRSLRRVPPGPARSSSSRQTPAVTPGTKRLERVP